MAENKSFGKIIGKGKRGIVKLGRYRGKVCAVKIPNPKSDAVNRLETESYWLKELNKKGIGPKLYFSDEKSLFMEYLDGVHLSDYLVGCSDEDSVLKEILRQCRVMDKLKVNKFEMHRITKNVIVVNGKPVLIDFERCKRVLVPKNVTQFCQFLFKRGLCKDSAKLVKALQDYKKDLSDSNYERLFLLFF